MTVEGIYAQGGALEITFCSSVHPSWHCRNTSTTSYMSKNLTEHLGTLRDFEKTRGPLNIRGGQIIS